MRTFRILIGLLLVIGTGLAAARLLGVRSAQASPGAPATPPQAPTETFPKDVYADTGNRLPAIKREDLDEAGKKVFDNKGGPADSFGPGAIRMYSPVLDEHMVAVNDYLRHKGGLETRYVELAILVAAREFDSEYVWTAHEPQALKAGEPQEIIDIVKFHKSAEGIAEKDAAIIQLGRETIERHHASSATAARAMSLFGKQGTVNLVSLMGDYASTAILLNAFDQHVRPADKPLLPIP